MWNLLPSNKPLESKMREKSYKQHLNKLIKMKSVVKIQPPPKLKFVYVNPKLEMSRRDRLIEIDRQNEILTTKMMNIRNVIYTDNKLRSQSQQLKTLNQVANEEQRSNIDKQNRRICQKLLRVSSHYPTFELLKNTQQSQQLRDKISQNARRSTSAKSIKTRPQSSSSKFYRSRISKYDNQGNSNEQINILYTVNRNNRRPLSAPAIKKFVTPYNTTNQMKQYQAQSKEQQGNLFSLFNSQGHPK